MREGRPGSVERLLDANANRAREGLRVAEDYARFIAGDAETARAIREVRHEVTRCAGLVGGGALLAERDVEGDGGASPEALETGPRSDLREVVTSSFKRAEEALRSLEEFTKLPEIENGMEASAGFERARYRLYELEKRTLSACVASSKSLAKGQHTLNERSESKVCRPLDSADRPRSG